MYQEKQMSAIVDEECVEIVQWQDEAIEYLQRNTPATHDVICRFVELYWESELPLEENLFGFENYMAELCDDYTLDNC